MSLFAALPVSALSFQAPISIRLLPSLHPRLTRTTNRFICSTPTPAAAPLYLVSTPIGNSLDLSPRARKILSSVHTIAAEDTRVTKTLLSVLPDPHAQGQSPAIISCNSNNLPSRLPHLLNLLTAGCSVALVSDAGTPCISDPGSMLVSTAVNNGIRVIPVPGPCAAVTAISASGIPASKYLFLGFLPRKGAERTAILKRILSEDVPVIFYESPHRIDATLQNLAQMDGEMAQSDTEVLRKVCLAREMTKKYEEMIRFTSLRQAAEYYGEDRNPRGEYTVVIEAREPDGSNDTLVGDVDFRKLVEELLKEGMGVSTVSRVVASCCGVSKNAVYSHAISIKKDR